MFIEVKVFVDYVGSKRLTVNVEAIESLQQGNDGKTYLTIRGEDDHRTILEPSYDSLVGMLANESLLLEPEKYGYAGISPEVAPPTVPSV